MSHPLRTHLEPVRRRQQLLSAVHATCWGLLLGGVAAFVLAMMRLFGVTTTPAWMLAAVGIGCGLGLVVGLVRGWSWHRAAAAVDAHYSLKDRVVSALAFSDGVRKPSVEPSVYELQIADTLERLQGIDAREVAPFALPRLLPAAVAVIACAFGLLFIPSGQRTVEAGPAPALAHVQSEAEYLEETMLPELRELLEEEDVVEPELKELVEQLAQLVEELGQEGVDEREALAKLSEMQMAIAAMQSQYNLEAVDAHMKSIGEALTHAAATKAAAEALAQGAYNQAAESLDQLDASKMQRNEAKSVAKQLKRLAKSLAEANQGQLSQAASEMSQGLENENDGQCKSGACKLAGLCRTQALRKKIGECLGCQLGRLAQCKGNCAGGKNGGSNVALSNRPSLKWGRGASNTPFGSEATDLGGQRDRLELTGTPGEGPSEKETLTSPEAREQARRGYRQEYQQYRKMAEAVTESEALPLGHRQIIRTYFEAIRPDAAEADAVLEAEIQ